MTQEKGRSLLANLAMAERGLERWDAAVANLREALEIYINLGDREMIGRSFTELTDAFIWAGRFQEAIETARRGLGYLEADVSADRVRLLATLGQARAAVAGYEPADEALREALDMASQLSDPKLDGQSARCPVDSKFHLLSVAGGRRRRVPQRTTGRIRSPSLAARPTVASSASDITLSWTPGRGGQNRG